MIALIPARSGSKGLPGKNIKVLVDKPLIAYAIDAALAAPSIHRVIVDTDDAAIARVAREYAAELPYQRPAALANDTASAVDVYLHAFQQLSCSELCVLLPTVPLRTADDIEAAVQLYQQNDAQSVISVCESETPATWLRTIDAKGVLRPLFADDLNNANRQAVAASYVPNGAIFILSQALLARSHSYYGERTYPYIMPRERSVDIDDAWDFTLAELIVQHQAGC